MIFIIPCDRPLAALDQAGTGTSGTKFMVRHEHWFPMLSERLTGINCASVSDLAHLDTLESVSWLFPQKSLITYQSDVSENALRIVLPIKRLRVQEGHSTG